MSLRPSQMRKRPALPGVALSLIKSTWYGGGMETRVAGALSARSSQQQGQGPGGRSKRGRLPVLVAG